MMSYPPGSLWREGRDDVAASGSLTATRPEPGSEDGQEQQDTARPEGDTRFALVDTETTGFSRHDRIVELACVTISEGQIVDEYESLLQPEPWH